MLASLCVIVLSYVPLFWGVMTKLSNWATFNSGDYSPGGVLYSEALAKRVAYLTCNDSILCGVLRILPSAFSCFVVQLP